MKKTIRNTLFLCTLLFGYSVTANASNSNSEKHFSIGVGSYAFSLANDDNDSGTIDFSGINVAAGYAFSNKFQIRATYFSLENDNGYSGLENKGFDLMAYGGIGLSKRGFRGYGGAGLFSEEWGNQGDSVSGFQFGGGLGYNWGPAALDFVLTLRQSDEYEDFVVVSGTYVAVSGNLTISYLF